MDRKYQRDIKKVKRYLRVYKWQFVWFSIIIVFLIFVDFLINHTHKLAEFSTQSVFYFLSASLVVCVLVIIWRDYISQSKIHEHLLSLNREMTEREAAESKLKQAYHEIEDKVRERTSDLTATQRELESSNALLGAVFQTMRAGILVMQRGSRRAVVNRAFADIWRLPTNEESWECRKLFPRLYDALPDPDDLVAQIEEIGTTMPPEQAKIYALKDGRLLEAYYLPFYVGGELKGRIHVFRDVSEIEENQQRLQATVNELETFKRALDFHAQVSLCDDKGIITYVNEQMCEVSGYTQDELLGRTHRVLKSGKHEPAYFEQMWSTLQRGDIWRGEIRNSKKNGDYYWVQSTLVPFFNKEGIPIQFLNISADITERKRGEEQLLVAKEAAESATRAKSEFLANISHEIRTPMNAILGFSELLSNEIEDTRHKEYLRLLTVSGNALLDLINDLLDLSKIESGKFSIQTASYDLKELFSEVQTIFSVRAEEKGLKLTASIDPEVPDYLMGDEVRMRQVLFNLVGNAIKFTEVGSVRMVLDLKQFDREKNLCDLQLTVTDTGIGISKKNLSLIFEAFHQAEGQSIKKFGGTGLGLAITKRLVEMMDGDVSVKSKEGEGSTFVVTLKNVGIPVGDELKDVIQDREDRRIALGEIAFEPATVFIADDDQRSRTLFKSFFDNTGVSILEASDGRDALQQIREHKPDLIIMGVTMPQLGGLEVAAQIRQDDALKQTPVILTTAMEPDKLKNAQNTNVEAYLFKPIDRNQLLSVAKQFLKTQSSSPEQRFEGHLTESHTAEFPLSELAKSKLDEMLSEMSGPLMHEWTLLNKRMKAHDLGTFADITLKAGERYNYEPLKHFSRQLMRRVEVFDIAGIRQTLQGYPSMVESLRKIKDAPEDSV